jgi:hypothetical protein
VFSVSLWLIFLSKNNHRDTENTEIAQRKRTADDFSGKAGPTLIHARQTNNMIVGRVFRCVIHSDPKTQHR